MRFRHELSMPGPASSGGAAAGGRILACQRRTLCAALFALLAALTVPPASAMQAERGETVTERTLPGYDALGLRLGAFDLFPSLELGSRYDDNIYRVDDDRAEGGTPSDRALFVHPRLRAQSRWSRHSLALDARARTDRFRDNEEEDNTDWFVVVTGHVDVGRDSELHASAELREQREGRGGAYSIIGGEPDTFETRTATVGWRNQLNRVSLSVDARYDDYEYDNPARQFRNRSDREWRSQAGYRFSPGYEAFARVTRFERRYDGRNRRGLDRDSDGWEFAAGVELDLGGLVFGELFAGYRRQAYEDAGLRSIKRPSFGAALDWNVTPLTTVSGRVSRTVQETVLDASGVLATQAEASVAHELLRNLVLAVTADYTVNNYRVIGRQGRHEGDIWGGEIGIRWLTKRRLHLDLSYRYETRDSTLPLDDYGNHVASLSVTLQL